MKGDFSRATFDRAAHRRNTLLQQGRVLLDATWNEQQETTQYRAETAAADLLGATGGPAEGAAFWLGLGDASLAASDFGIGPGRYYVDGILCENELPTSYLKQADWPGAAALAAGVHLVYLDVWLRHVTALEAPRLRETALGGADADTRVQVVWQVKTAPLRTAPLSLELQRASLQAQLQQAWTKITTAPSGMLAARTVPMAPDDKPCLLPPAAGFQGLENQLYRVEIHQPGEPGTASFKWSRDNGALVVLAKPLGPQKFAVVDGLQGGSIPFAGGDWAELCDDSRELLGLPGEMVRVSAVDPAGQSITLATTPTTIIAPGKTCQLRKWDGVGAATIPVPPATGETWVPLEDGVEVRFAAGAYRTGNWWLIPARVSSADIEWLRDAARNPLLASPAGVQHHYARLALLTHDGTQAKVVEDLRSLVAPLSGTTTLTKTLANLGANREVALADGMDVRSDWLARGLYLAFDRPLDPQSLSPAACAVTVELPFPGNDQDRKTYGAGIFGYQPVVLAGALQADAVGGLLWQPEAATRDLLLRGLPNIVRRKAISFDQDWDASSASASATGKWDYAADGSLLQTSRDPKDGFGTMALSKPPLPVGANRVAASMTLVPLSNEQSDVGIVFHWKDAANYSGVVLQSMRSTSFSGDLGVNTTATLFQVRNGQRAALANSLSRFDGSFRIARAEVTVTQPTALLLSFTVRFLAADGSQVEPSLTLPTPASLASPTPLAGARAGVFARNASAQFFALAVGVAGQSADMVLLPGGGAERALARLTVRRSLLRPAAASAPRFAPVAPPQPDCETWFWLVNPPRYYGGGSSGIGVGLLSPGGPA